jgi:hypothetical protein
MWMNIIKKKYFQQIYNYFYVSKLAFCMVGKKSYNIKFAISTIFKCIQLLLFKILELFFLFLLSRLTTSLVILYE